MLYIYHRKVFIMTEIIGVKFKSVGKVYYFSPNGLELALGDKVIVETARGIECGEVSLALKEISDDEINSPLKSVIRKATEEDLKTIRQNEEKEKDAFKICEEKIAKHELKMNLIDVECTFDNNKLLFYFTADNRVDFRELVKDLASIFHARIELRQIGIRDETKMLGGLGPCGRACCCNQFLKDFERVSIKMAKTQGLSLNPAKISGLCGRLMCCLKYENNHYTETARLMPKVGSEVVTPDGRARVESVNLLKKSVLVKIVNGDAVEFKTFDVADVKAKKTIAEDVDDTVADEEIKSILD